MALLQDLQKIGLNEKEARVFLASLELGPSSVQQISKKASINRTTTYFILDSLIHKGLTSTYLKGKKTYFMAESPEVLGNLFDLQKKNIEEKQKKFETLMPELKALYNQLEGKPVVRFFEGKEGLKAISNEFLNSNEKNVRMLYSVDDVRRVFADEERAQARKRRIDKKIHTRVLYTYKDGVLESTADGERIKISEKEFPVSADIALFDGKVRISSLGGKKLSGVIIQDQEIYKTLSSLFDLAWEAAKKRAKK